MKVAVGVDAGTQSLKVLAYAVDTNSVLARTSCPLSLLPSTVTGRAEQDPHSWVQALSHCLSELNLPSSAIVTAIAVSGQQHGLVALDSSGSVIRPAKLWCDVESAPEASEISTVLGYTLPAGFTCTKFLWLARHEPESFEKLHTLLLPHDYLNFVLSGVYAMECGDASGVGTMDLKNRVFDKTRCEKVHPKLFQSLPSLVPPDKPIGAVTAEAASTFNLPKDALVAPGGGDNMMSALGAGAVRPGVLVLSLGTSATLFGYSETPLEDASGTVAPFCDSTGAYLPLLCVQNCTSAVNEIAHGYGMSHDALMELAEKEPAGCEGLTYLPYLTGERTPNWPDASGALLGLRPGLFRPGLVYRAALEGATFSVLHGYKVMQSFGFEATELRVVGGGSKNTLWRRIIADAFQVQLKFPLEPESAALGAALQAAAIAEGQPVAEYVRSHEPPMSDVIVIPDASVAQQYASAFERFSSRGKTLFG
ncbi:hypothetical protein PPROV_000028400 [Pycnococcus provasolii]|uniref:glycerol kinase n=2 Tax=Pycnococcus provasolii TaxID=41880 RepID=A0A830H4H9_9CHLO|nr:hypothetical protein PPROV_000028400 [Pycnococcus provasolii]